MKVPDSGMPDEAYWESLFDLDRIMDWMQVGSFAGTILEVGCGYGTFTLPLVQRGGRRLIGLDIDPVMIDRTKLRLTMSTDVCWSLHVRDVLAEGFGVPDESMHVVMMFNILHFEGRQALLAESARVLAPGGKLYIIHWRRDIATPRGPDPLIRPVPGDILENVRSLPLKPLEEPVLLEPWHWGLILEKEHKHENRNHSGNQ